MNIVNIRFLRRNSRRWVSVSVAALLCAASSAAVAADEGWDWSIAPYLWGSSIATDFNVRGRPVEGEANFSNIVDKLDYAFQMHVEGQGETFGMFADYTYLKLSDQRNRDFLGIDASLDSTLFELAMVWSPGEQRHRGFEAFGGLRYLNTGVDVKFDFTNPALPDQRRTLDKSYTDALIGARYTADLSDRWAMTLRGDGSFGDTEGSYSASILFQYQTGSGAWGLGYRYLDIEVATHDENAKITMSGPVVGYAFKF
jgi:hypothetical protein